MKYKQGHDVLRNIKDEYCCLGVLCDISGQDKWVGNTYQSYSYGYNYETTTLPLFVSEWAGLGNQSDPFLGEHRCSAHNDGDFDYPAKNFNEIADLIEEYL